MGRKHCGKRRNCSLRAISPFPTVFSKDFYYRLVKKGLVWERVNVHVLSKFLSDNHAYKSCHVSTWVRIHQPFVKNVLCLPLQNYVNLKVTQSYRKPYGLANSKICKFRMFLNIENFGEQDKERS